MNQDRALRLDSEDPLARFRDRFVIEDPDVIYMDGNSLGRLPRATVARLESLIVQEWGSKLVGGWHEWIEMSTRIGDKIARSVGALQGEVIVADSTSVNLYKLAMAACDARPGRNTIVTDHGNFPSDLYVLQGVAKARGMDLVMADLPDLEGSIDERVAFVCLSHVGYKTGSLLDMANITEMAHSSGALMLWDLCHSVGVVPIDLEGSGVDLAVGCTYKYLNGGPGAPAFLYVRSDLQGSMRQPIWGWFGQTEQFAMRPGYDPAPGVDRFASGTPPILSLAAVEVGIDITLEAGIDAIRRKSLAQTSMLIDLADGSLGQHGVSVATPRDPRSRGSHVALRHPEALRLSRSLIARSGVIPDFREPDILRYGVAPLYTRFIDVHAAVERLAATLSAGRHLEVSTDRPRVT